MKLSRKKLRQLIEAFISGPLGTKHIPDEDYPYHKLEKQLGGDSDMISKMQTLARGDKASQNQFRELEKAFPLLGDDGEEIETDYIGDTQEMHDQYDSDAYQLLLSKVKNIAQQIHGLNVRSAYEPNIEMTADSLQAAQRFVQEIKQQGLDAYLSYGNSGMAALAAQQGTYIVDFGPGKLARNQSRYQIMLDAKNPNWWRGFQNFPS